MQTQPHTFALQHPVTDDHTHCPSETCDSRVTRTSHHSCSLCRAQLLSHSPCCKHIHPQSHEDTSQPLHPCTHSLIPVSRALPTQVSVSTPFTLSHSPPSADTGLPGPAGSTRDSLRGSIHHIPRGSLFHTLTTTSKTFHIETHRSSSCTISPLPSFPHMTRDH